MAIPVMGVPQLEPKRDSILSSITSGVKAAYLPKELKQAEQQRALANALSQIALQYAPDMTQAELAYKQAQTPHLNAQTNLIGEQAKYFGPSALSQIGLQGAQTGEANARIPLINAQAELERKRSTMPFLGQQLPGSAGKVMALESLKQMFGENSPQYQQARTAFELEQKGDQSRINYQDVLAQTMPVRSLSPTGKNFVEESNVNAGMSPTGAPYTNAPVVTPQEASNTYDLVRQKGATDTDTRKRNLFATNIEKTLSMINPDDLTAFAGAQGTTKKAAQSGLAMFGKQSKEYDNYLKAVQNAELAATQIRQFYGDSIQPSMIERLEKLTNPATLLNNPKLAKQLYSQTVNVLKQEIKTYRDALKTTAAYQSQDNQAASAPTAQSAQQPSMDDIRHTAQKYNISEEEVKRMLGVK